MGTDATASLISTVRVVRSKLPWSGPIPVRYAVYLDDRLIGRLRPGEWLERRVGPGAHEVYVKAFFRQRSVTLVTEVDVGEDATLRCAFDPKAEAFDGPDGESMSIRIWREDGPVPEAFRRLPGTRAGGWRSGLRHRSGMTPEASYASGMSRLTREELDGMRRLATHGYVPFWGTIDAERPEDFEVRLKRSQIADYQNALLRAVEEIERCYERLPTQ